MEKIFFYIRSFQTYPNLDYSKFRATFTIGLNLVVWIWVGLKYLSGKIQLFKVEDSYWLLILSQIWVVHNLYLDNRYISHSGPGVWICEIRIYRNNFLHQHNLIKIFGVFLRQKTSLYKIPQWWWLASHLADRHLLTMTTINLMIIVIWNIYFKI